METAEAASGKEAGDTYTALLNQIKKNIRESRRHFSDWREQATEDYAFFAGEQWSPEDKQKLESEGRPAVVFNRIARTVNAVLGLEVQNRQEARYFPREINDKGVNELLTDAAKWVRESCDAEDEESEAYLDTLVCGVGYTETRLDYEQGEESMILIERRDPFEMGVDHCAKKRNFDDKRFIYRIQKYSQSEFEEQWPDAEIPQSSLFDDEEQNGPHRVDPVDGYRNKDDEGKDNDARTIQVAQYQYWELQKFRPVQDETGQITEMPEERFQAIRQVADERGWQYAKAPRKKRVYYQVFLTSSEILEKAPAPCNQFTFHAITGLRDRNENIWFGLVRLMKDPQRWANKWLSQIQHILNTQAKQGKVLAERGAIGDMRSFRQDWAKPDMPAIFEDGALKNQQVIVHQGSGYPDGVDRLLQYALTAVNDAPGVNLEMIGLANRDQPGVLEESRKQAGITVLAVFFDSLRRYRKEQGRTTASFITDYISDGRLIRIVGPEGAQYVPLLKDKMTLKYDVVVSEAPTSPNSKEKTYAALQMLLPTVLQAGIPVPPDLLDYTPLPLALQEKWKKFISEKGNDPETQMQKQMAMQAGQAEIEAKSSQAQLNKAKAMKEMADLQNANPQAQFQMERERGLLDVQLKREEAAANIQLKREEMAANMELKRMDLQMKHEVQRENNSMQAKAASKPAASIQLGSDEAVAGIGEQMMQSNNMLAQSLMQGFQAIAESNLAVAKALSAPKRIIEDGKGRAIGVESVH